MVSPTLHTHGRTAARWLVAVVMALALALIGTQAPPAQAQTVSSVSGSSLSDITLYYSKNAPATYNTQYVGIRVTNSATPRESLWVKVTDVNGGNAGLAVGETGERSVGEVGANASKVVYFLFRARTTARTTTDTTFNIRLYDGAPGAGGTLISTTPAAITEVNESQNASANKVTGGYVSPSAPTLGSEFQVVLTGLTGTMSNSNNSTAVFTPAFAQGWDPSAFELTKVDLQFDFNPSGSQAFSNQLYFPVTNNGGGAALKNDGGAYTATYTFRAVNRTNAAVRPTPVGHIKSGGIWKYTNASSLSSIAPIEPVTNSFIITAEASPTQSADGYIRYILTLANTSTKTLSVDLMKDVLPSGATYQDGTSRYNGSAIPDPSNSGGTLTWSGPFTVAGGARVTLSYQVLATPTTTATDYSNSATGMVGATVIDRTLDTTDNDPAVATATVDSDFDADTTAPTINLSAVDGASAAITAGGSTTSTSATMTFSAPGEAQAPTFTCSIDGEAPTSCSSPGSYAGLAAGSHTFWVYAKDAAGNIGSASLTWTVINTSRPEVARFLPSVTASKTSPLTFSLDFTKDITPGSLTTSDLAVVATGSPGTWTISSVIGSGSQYIVTVSSGSPGTSGTVGLRLAADAVTDASDNARTGPTTAQASGTVTMSNTTDVEITSATPAAGSTSNSTTATFSFGPPAGAYPPDQYKCQGPGESSFTECVSPVTYTGVTGGSKTFSVIGELIADNDTGSVTATTATRTSTWTVDLTAPAVTLTTPASAALLNDSTPTLSGACTDAEGDVSVAIYTGASASGIAAQTITAACSAGAWSTTATTLADGEYTARASQTDAPGNTGQSSARTFTIDGTAPTVTVTPDAASTSTSSASFSVLFSEGVSGFDAADLVIGGTSALPAWSVSNVTGSGAAYTVNLTAASTPTAGTLTLKVAAGAVSDAAGNPGPIADSAVASMDVVASGELTGGSVSANNGNAWGASRNVAVAKSEVTANGGGVTNRLFRLVAPWNNGACGDYGAGTEIDLATTSDDTTPLGDACFRYDLVGTKGNSSRTLQSNVVKVDLTPPAVDDLEVAGGTDRLTSSPTPAIAKGNRSDAASGLKASEEKLTRASTAFANNACDPFTTYDPDNETVVSLAATADSGLASGCYRYTHRVADNATPANVTTKQSVVKVDVDRPTGGTMAANSGLEWTSDETPSLGGTAFSDVHSGIGAGGAGITRERTALDGADCDSSGWTVQTTAVNDTGGAENTALGQACYRYTRTATDRAGNSAATPPVVVKIDLTRPTPGALAIAGGDDRITNDIAPSISRGTDVEVNSGIRAATEKLTRASTSYSAGACGTFAAYNDGSGEATVSNSADADSGLSTGCYRYTRKVGDNAGNTATATAVVRVDATNPVLGDLQVAGGNDQLTNSASPAIAKGARSDAASGLKASEEKLTRASTAFADNACEPFAAYDPGTEANVGLVASADSGLTSGCYRYTHRVSDNAGNVVTAQSVVRIDVNAPTGGSITANSGNPWTNSQGPALTGTAFADAHSGIAAGGAGITRERTALTGATCDESGWTVQTTSVNDTGGADNATLDQACYRYTRTATDRAGNAASTTAAVVKIDRTSPTGGAISLAASGWTRSQNPAVGGSMFTDDNSGIASSSLTRERAPLVGQTCGTYGPATAVTLSNGEDAATLDQACYRYTRGASDVAGNATSTDAEVKIDRTNPTGGAVTANGADATWTKDLKPLLTRSAVGDDNSGLASESFTRGFAAFNASGNCTGVTYSGSTAVTIGGDGRDADSSMLAEGCYRYRSSASDAVGNSTTNDATVFIDRTAPTGGTLAVTRTSGPWANTARPGITGTGFQDANSGLNPSTSATRIVRERAEYVPGSNNCSSTWTTDKDPVVLSAGTDADTLGEACYRYVRRAEDNAGNTASTTPDAVQLDLTGPTGGTVLVNGGTDVDATEGTPATVDVSAFSDRLSGIPAGSESLTRRIAPWVGSTSASQSLGTRAARTRAEFGDYGSAVPVTLMGNEDPIAVTPGRYFYEHTVTDAAGNTSVRTALVEIRPRGYVPPVDPDPSPTAPVSGGTVGSAPSGVAATTEAPLITATMRVSRTRVRTGRVVPLLLIITNSGGHADRMVASIRLRAGMSLAKIPRGARLRDGRLVIPVGNLAPGASTQIKVFLRVSTTRTRSTRVRGTVHRHGAADIAAISPKIRVIAAKRRTGVTG